MYIVPQTSLHILHNVPLDTTYDHTINFISASAQYTYFNSLAKYRNVQYSYVEPNSGVVRVGITADDLYDCNYIMFQNTAFGSKWFYAYITAVKYMSNQTAEISFELDVIQSWLFDFTPDYCYVERTHTLTDVIGEHIEAEPVELGEYIMNDYSALTDMDSMATIIAIADVDQGADGKTYDGIYGGCELWAFDQSDAGGINGKINEYIQAPDSIVAIYMCPKAILASSPEVGQPVKILSSQVSRIINIEKSGVGPTLTLDGFVPQNCKMYTYPYNFYHVDNANGSSLSLRYEFFANGRPQFHIRGSKTQPVMATLYPANYKGTSWNPASTGDRTYNAETISLAGYPMCSWAVDSYAAWIAQNSIPLAVSTAREGIGAVSQILGGNISGGVMSAIDTVINVQMQKYQASIAADMVKGSANVGNVNCASNKQNFYGGRCSVTKYNGKIIDDFFTMFGYGVKTLMQPRYNARAHWTYIKTANATLTGSVPADAMRNICHIFNRGITFWANGAEVGNYSLDNRASVRGVIN